MGKRYCSPSHGGDIPIPALRGMQGLVPPTHSSQHPPPRGPSGGSPSLGTTVPGTHSPAFSPVGAHRDRLYPPPEPSAGHQSPLPVVRAAPVPALRALVGLMAPPSAAQTLPLGPDPPAPGPSPALTLAESHGTGQAAGSGEGTWCCWLAPALLPPSTVCSRFYGAARWSAPGVGGAHDAQPDSGPPAQCLEPSPAP